jgi:hypothetical protein
VAALREKLTYANVMATIAVFIALGGGAIAATQLPKNSVGAKQIKKEAVTPAKLSVASKAALTGPPGPKGEPGTPGAPGSALGYAHIVEGELIASESKGVVAITEGVDHTEVNKDNEMVCFKLSIEPVSLSVLAETKQASSSHQASEVSGAVPGFPPHSSHSGCPTGFRGALVESYAEGEATPVGLWVVFY